MKKAIALLIVALFVLSTTSFAAWWNFGRKKGTEEAAAKTKVETKVKKEEGKKVGSKKVMVKKTVVTKKVMKKMTKKGATPAVPPKK